MIPLRAYFTLILILFATSFPFLARAHFEQENFLSLKKGDSVLVNGFLAELVRVLGPDKFQVHYRVGKQEFQKTVRRQELYKEVPAPPEHAIGMKALVGNETGRILHFFEKGYIRFLPDREMRPGSEYRYRRDYENPENDPAILALQPGSYALEILHPTIQPGTPLGGFDDARLEAVFDNGYIQISYVDPYRLNWNDRVWTVLPMTRYPGIVFSSPKPICESSLTKPKQVSKSSK